MRTLFLKINAKLTFYTAKAGFSMRPELICFSRWAVLLFTSFLLVVSCKKTEAPDPDLASKVMGTYKVAMVSIPGSNQPIVVTGGTVVLFRNGAALDKVDITLSYATAGTMGSTSFSETRTLSLQQSGNAIDLLNGTTKIGSWVANTLTFTDYPFNNSTVSFTATR